MTTLFKISKPIPPVKPSTPSALLLYSVLKPCFHLTYCILVLLYYVHGLPMWCSGKEPACQCRRCKRYSVNPWVRKMSWRSKWPSAPVFLPGKFHGQRSLVGYSPCGRKESDMTECIQTHTHTHTCIMFIVSFPVRKYLEQELWSGFTCCYIFSPPCA